ncbi:MAG: hypothetical protein WDZ76_09030 [Pseudohongiellaceae bacterium]
MVVEYDTDAPGVSEGMKAHVGGTKEEFTRQIEAAGFQLVEDVTLPEMQETFIRRFRKNQD